MRVDYSESGMMVVWCEHCTQRFASIADFTRMHNQENCDANPADSYDVVVKEVGNTVWQVVCYRNDSQYAVYEFPILGAGIHSRKAAALRASDNESLYLTNDMAAFDTYTEFVAIPAL